MWPRPNGSNQPLKTSVQLLRKLGGRASAVVMPHRLQQLGQVRLRCCRSSTLPFLYHHLPVSEALEKDLATAREAIRAAESERKDVQRERDSLQEKLRQVQGELAELQEVQTELLETAREEKDNATTASSTLAEVCAGATTVSFSPSYDWLNRRSNSWKTAAGVSMQQSWACPRRRSSERQCSENLSNSWRKCGDV